MTFSLNEAETMARKAARGAGYGWGLSEDAGKAVRWLCSQGFDGCAALAALLPASDGKNLFRLSPRVDRQPWTAADGAGLCPIHTGAALADRAHALPDTGQRLGLIRQPLLLLPFVAQVAAQRGSTMTLSCLSVQCVTNGERTSMTGSCGDIWPEARVVPGGTVGAPTPLLHRASPDPEVWAVLARFAHRTYAPATDESRARGAGSDLSDND